jgi:Fe-S-cluster formation regulator IscX/YfhJ
MNKPKISAADINESAKISHTERTLKIKEIL